MKFIIRERECGNEIATFDSYEDALEVLREYEAEDNADGCYEENFYEIIKTDDPIISGIYVKPQHSPMTITIQDTLKELQLLVEGHIEYVFPIVDSDLVFIVNEEGLINDMKYNLTINGIHLFGPILIFRLRGETLQSLTDEDMTLIENIIRKQRGF